MNVAVGYVPNMSVYLFCRARENRSADQSHLFPSTCTLFMLEIGSICAVFFVPSLEFGFKDTVPENHIFVTNCTQPIVMVSQY